MFASDSFSKEAVVGSFVREIRLYWRMLTRVKRCNCLSNLKKGTDSGWVGLLFYLRCCFIISM